MAMSLRENITGVIETCFSETKDEIQEVAINRILELIRADRKTEQTADNLSAVEDEPLTCDGNCWMKKQNGEWLCEHCQREPKDEQTEREGE